jgi:hypothetical protein
LLFTHGQVPRRWTDDALDYAAREKEFENATRLLVVLLKIKHSSRVDEVIGVRRE